MKRDNDRQTAIILSIVGIVPVIWLALLIAPSISGGLPEIAANLPTLFDNPFSIKLCGDSLKTVLILLLCYGMGIGIYFSTRKNYRRREEHGSAKWGNVRAIDKKYRQKPLSENKLMTQNVCIGLNAKKHRRNLNTLVCGGSGAGKTTDLHSIECYDPSAGTGTLLMALAHKIGEDKCTIFAQDISQRSNKMLKLNLILNSLVSSLDHAIQGDTLIAPYHKSDNGQELRTFDYVVSNPPFKMDFSDTRERIAAMPVRFWAGVPKVPAKKKESMAIYTLFIQHVLNSLKSTGKGAIVVPTGFVTAKSGVEKKILQHIVDEHIVYGCISMPSNVFANTGTNVSVLFFDNSRKTDKVVLIDASKLGEEYKDGNNQKRRLRDFEIDKIVDTFLNKEAVDDFSVAVTYDEIKEKKYSLSAGQYFDVKIEYVELSQDEFNARMSAYAEKLQEYFAEGDKLKTEIMEQLKKVKYE